MEPDGSAAPPTASMPPPPPRQRHLPPSPAMDRVRASAAPGGVRAGAAPGRVRVGAAADLRSLAHALPPAGPPGPAGVDVDGDLSARSWRECFDACDDVQVEHRDGMWRVYSGGFGAADAAVDVVLVLMHGGGHCALSWALVADVLRKECAVVAFDARGHGASVTADDADLCHETQVTDAEAVVRAFFARRAGGGRSVPKIVLCGHSMGGAIAVRLAVSGRLPEMVGLVVIDVVEGTAMSALPYMASWLQNRPRSFPSVEKAVQYVVKAGHVRNVDSARLSLPQQVVYNEKAKRWVWRTNLEASERFWKGWFQGLSSLFLSAPAAKMLVLAGVDRLDKDLMIAQMQGKFQNMLIPGAGHAVHEDQPEQTAQVLLEFLRRNMFISPSADGGSSIVFQQRRPPIPPCC